MAADDPSKKSSKIVWRTCVLCPTRLSELCYDTHLKCESCRGQVCSDVIFCSECEGWSSDFRKLYLKHKKSLHTKRVSKQNRRAGKSKGKSPSTIPPPQRADAPTPSDDAASVASQESHVTPPVVYFPLNQDIINANITVEQLQQFQQVDNIVEVQLENPPAPTTVPPQFDSTSSDRTDKVVTAIEKMLPFLVELVAERQSEKEKKSASAINPVVSPPVSAPQVPVVALQDPSPAPGPSDASLEPLPSTSGLQQPPQHAVASPRGRSSERVTSERSRHASPSFQDRLRLHIDDVKRQLSNTMEIDDLYRSQGRLPPDQISHDLGYLQDRLSHLQSSLADSLASSLGVITSTCAHAVASPAPTPVASGSSTSRFSSRHDRRYEQRVASSDIGAISGRPCSRESSQTSPHHPSSQRFSSSKRSLSPRRTPSPTQRRGTSRRTPSPTQRRGAFSKATNNIASALTSSTAFLTLKRRQLLLSHVVPSVSEAQKRNLLADPFFQTSSLFDSSSLESARSAARDMSLFKPHLKASTSSSQGRRQGPSTSSHRRGAARQYSGASSSQRASSPPRQQSFKKGEARFHKKSSGAPQKRGGFRK